MTIDTVHEELIRANLASPMTEDDALLWMALLHTHEIHFRSPLLSDRPNVTFLSPLTRSSCSEVMAALWRGRERADRAGSTYWSYQYAVSAGYEVVEGMPPDELHRLEQLRDQLAADPRLEKIVPED